MFIETIFIIAYYILIVEVNLSKHLMLTNILYFIFIFNDHI